MHPSTKVEEKSVTCNNRKEGIQKMAFISPAVSCSARTQATRTIALQHVVRSCVHGKANVLARKVFFGAVPRVGHAEAPKFSAVQRFSVVANAQETETEHNVGAWAGFRTKLVANLVELNDDLSTQGQKIANILVFGGNGALGSDVLKRFKEEGFPTFSVDRRVNLEADHSFVLPSASSFAEQAESLVKEVDERLKDRELKAIVVAAGGWAGGNIGDPKIFETADNMWQVSMQSSLVAAHIASKYLGPNGLLVLVGSAAAFKGTPGMIGYGIAKAAVHQLVASLAAPGSGLPENCHVLGIVPVVIDTPANRGGDPEGSHDDWTPLSDLSTLIHRWTTSRRSRPPSGTLVKVVTKNRITSTEFYEYEGGTKMELTEADINAAALKKGISNR
mmetsp:Transcript_18903/g.31438  ORF Transcript_18903/g.31438 Transcript_18903/m.31438 type:complete len:390 (-) Transcript_18903:45-1214(-)